MIFVEVTINPGKKILCGSIYRPPNTNLDLFLEEYENTLRELKKINTNVVLGLDHNLDFLKADKHKSTQHFIESTLEQSLVPTITRPTRITKTTATLIDNIIVSQNYCGKFSSHVLIDSTSDHLPILVMLHDIKHLKNKKISITSRDTRKINLMANLNEHDWTEDLQSNEYDRNIERIHKRLIDKIDHFIPERTRQINYKNLRWEPWLTTDIQISNSKARKLYKNTLKETSNESDLLKYKTYNNALSKLKRTAKRTYYLVKCETFKHNTRKLWEVINEISGKVNDKTSIIDCICVEDIAHYKSKDIANAFGSYFGDIGKRFANKIPASTYGINHYLERIRINKLSLFLALA